VPAPGRRLPLADHRPVSSSSATHAGGVIGMPGHHCVREIMKDKALKKLKA
jgi:hypothetical protein